MSDKINLPSPGFLASQLTRLHHSMLGERIARFGLNFGALGYVVQAKRFPGKSQNDLAALVSVDKAATARALSSLEKKGFITRKVNPENHRQKLVYPTKKIDDIWEEFVAELIEHNEILLDGFDEQELQTGLRFLSKMVDNCRGALGLPLLNQICEGKLNNDK